MSQETSQAVKPTPGGEPETSTLQATNQLIAHARTELGRVISGQSGAIEEVADGRAVPGPRAARRRAGNRQNADGESAGAVAGLGFQRVQATPDLMPADILGTSILRPGTDAFTFHAGPVFTDLLLVDEINRMPPRTQAALLECMEERQVTIDGVRRPLPAWFTVFATQNPVDFEGTYPLPEAQLDRFLMKIRVAYPSEVEELQILERHHAGSGAGLLDDAADHADSRWTAGCRPRRGPVDPDRAGALSLHSESRAPNPRMAYAAAGRKSTCSA